MASTYSTALRLELMATGDQSGTWGDTTNTNLGTLLEQAITGVLSVAEGDTTLTLTANNGASDQSRNMVINLTGAMTGAQNVVVPTSNKVYLIKNSTTGGFAVTVKTAAGTGVAIPATTARWVYCDGTNVVDGMSGPWTPSTNAGAALGTASIGWSALFIESASAGTLETLTSTDAGATAGPVLDIYRNSASPAASDILGRMLFNGEDSAGNKQEYGSIEAVVIDPTSTSEDGSLDFYATVAGTRTRVVSIGPNLDLAAIGQIKFPAAANPSSNANTLDDYEEGTFTPIISGSTTAGTGTYTVQVGTYTKIGNVVFYNFTAAITAHTGTGNIVLDGLPFTSAATTNNFSAQSVFLNNFNYGATIPQARIDMSSTTINLVGSVSGTVVTSYALDTACTVIVAGMYFV